MPVRWDGFKQSANGSHAEEWSGGRTQGRKHGSGVWTHNGDTFHGTFNLDMREGPGTYTWADGTMFRGVYCEDKLSHGQLVYADGGKYAGQFDNDLPCGLGVSLWPDGAAYFGDHLHGNMHGQGEYIFPLGSTYADRSWVGPWENGKRVRGADMKAGLSAKGSAKARYRRVLRIFEELSKRSEPPLLSSPSAPASATSSLTSSHISSCGTPVASRTTAPRSSLPSTAVEELPSTVAASSVAGESDARFGVRGAVDVSTVPGAPRTADRPAGAQWEEEGRARAMAPPASPATAGSNAPRPSAGDAVGAAGGGSTSGAGGGSISGAAGGGSTSGAAGGGSISGAAGGGSTSGAAVTRGKTTAAPPGSAAVAGPHTPLSYPYSGGTSAPASSDPVADISPSSPDPVAGLVAADPVSSVADPVADPPGSVADPVADPPGPVSSVAGPVADPVADPPGPVADPTSDTAAAVPPRTDGSRGAEEEEEEEEEEAAVEEPVEDTIMYTHTCGQEMLPFSAEQAGCSFSCPGCSETFVLTKPKEEKPLSKTDKYIQKFGVSMFPA